MGPDSPKQTRPPGNTGSSPGRRPASCLDIEIDDRAGTVRVHDPRSFQAGRRGFCQRLLEAALGQPGVRRAEVDLPTASCLIEFHPGAITVESMAGAFIRAVREAAASRPHRAWTACWRRRRGWSTLTAFPSPQGVSLWETHEVKPGRIRLYHPALGGDRVQLARLADTLAAREGVKGCRVSPIARRITLDYLLDDPSSNPGRLLDHAEQALERRAADDLTPTGWAGVLPAAAAGGPVVLATGARRLGCLALAGGSFALTLVALAVPGVPSTPGLLATHEYLARSAPGLNERLIRSAFFGPMLQNPRPERPGRPRRPSQPRLTHFTPVIVILTVTLSLLTPITLVLIVVLSSLSISGIARMPALRDDAWLGPRRNGHAPLALPAP